MGLLSKRISPLWTIPVFFFSFLLFGVAMNAVADQKTGVTWQDWSGLVAASVLGGLLINSRMQRYGDPDANKTATKIVTVLGLVILAVVMVTQIYKVKN